MKRRLSYIKTIVAIALIAILGLQFLWLYKLYLSYRNYTADLISQKLIQAIDYELIGRIEQLGGSASYTFLPIDTNTSSLQNTKIVTEDTTIVIPYNAAYRYDDKKANQSILKYLIPLNINELNSIFHQLLTEIPLPVKQTAIELYDKDGNDILRTDCIVRTLRWQSYETEILFVDLLDSIGIKVYVQTPYIAIFQQMLLQLILSAVLILSVMACLFRLFQTIFRQQQAEKIKKGFVDTMTHELKRPIASSIFMLELLHGQIQENQWSSAGELLDDSIFALKKLNLYVEKIQEISREENGKVDLARESIPLLPFFTQLKKRYEALPEKTVAIHLQIEEGISFVSDKVHFSNVMENLTENAIKYSGENVAIEINAFRKNDLLHILHRDNGWGIAESEIDLIFDTFYRGKSAEKRRKSGFGLGLSYVKLVVDAMGGSISVQSQEKTFTEFILTLPL